MNAPPPSSAASKLFLVVAIALGVLATVLAFAFINRAGAGTDGPQVKILIATRDIPVNSVVDPDRDLKEQPIPQQFVALQRLTLDPLAKANYRGTRVNRPINAGQPIFLADLGSVVDYQPAPGLVAFPILAEPGIAIPGDYVKILVSRPDIGTSALSANDPSRAPAVASYAAKGVAFRVVAISGSLTRTRSQILASEASGSTGAKQITLEASEPQAAEIQSAIGAGTTKAVLVLVSPPAAASPASPPPPAATSTGTKL